MNNCGLEAYNKLLKLAIGVNCVLTVFFQRVFAWLSNQSTKRNPAYVNAIGFILKPTIPPSMWVTASFIFKNSKLANADARKDYFIINVSHTVSNYCQ